MGNYQHTGRQLWAHQCMPRGALQGFRYSLSGNSDTESESDDRETLSCSDLEKFQNAVVNNNVCVLKDLINSNHVDLNVPINSKDETALMMSVKLSHLDMVQALLNFPNCNNNCHNVYHFSVLDAALITLFDRRDTDDCERCWEILVVLLRVKSEPLSKDAMTYVIRTALKQQDTDFIKRLIHTFTQVAKSTSLHLYLLEKLHRHQPIYPGDLDPILEQMTEFTISLLRSASLLALRQVVHSMVYYLESYWKCRGRKTQVFQRLVVYASGAGWNWTSQQIAFIEKVSPGLALWCCRSKTVPPSLSHTCRLSFRASLPCSVNQAIDSLPHGLPDLLKKYLLLHDLDNLPDNILHLQL